MYRFLFPYRLDMSTQAKQWVRFSTVAISSLSESRIMADSQKTGGDAYCWGVSIAAMSGGS